MIPSIEGYRRILGVYYAVKCSQRFLGCLEIFLFLRHGFDPRYLVVFGTCRVSLQSPCEDIFSRLGF